MLLLCTVWAGIMRVQLTPPCVHLEVIYSDVSMAQPISSIGHKGKTHMMFSVFILLSSGAALSEM